MGVCLFHVKRLFVSRETGPQPGFGAPPAPVLALRSGVRPALGSRAQSGWCSGPPKSGLVKSGLVNVGREPVAPSLGLENSGPL
ncbi:hypothetical protein GCM10010273_33600 [Streptomyces lavendulocolor]